MRKAKFNPVSYKESKKNKSLGEFVEDEQEEKD